MHYGWKCPFIPKREMFLTGILLKIDGKRGGFLFSKQAAGSRTGDLPIAAPVVAPIGENQNDAPLIVRPAHQQCRALHSIQQSRTPMASPP